MNIIHPSNCVATLLHSSTSSPYTAADKPKSLAFAKAIDSAILLLFMIDATGPNTSSRQLVICGWISAKTVAAYKLRETSIIDQPVTKRAH